MSFRESIVAICPPWLTGAIGGGFMYAQGLMIDALSDWTNQGIKARMPGVGTPDALYLIGKDRQIDRGPNETDAGYAVRLSSSFDTWATAGNAGTLLKQLAVWFTPVSATPIRLVSDRAIWQSINLSTNAITQTNVGTNWSWDGLNRWWRGWVIIDSSAGPWTIDGPWGGVVKWGDGGTWGSNAKPGEVAQIVSIIRKWKPANVTAQVIVTFDATLYTVAATSPPNPNADYAPRDTARLGKNANFWGFTG